MKYTSEEVTQNTTHKKREDIRIYRIWRGRIEEESNT